MALMSYTIRDRHRTYYFRRVIPAELRPFMPPPWTGKANWKRSLETKDPRVARREAAKKLTACEADFEAAERAMRGKEPEAAPPAAEPVIPPGEEIEADEYARLMAEDEQERSDGDARRQLQTSEEREQLGPDLVPIDPDDRYMLDDHYHAYGQWLRDQNEIFRRAVSTLDFRAIHPDVRNYLRRRGLPVWPGTPGYDRAAHAVLRAHARAHEAMLRRHTGEVVPTPPPTIARGPTISEAYEAWKKGGDNPGSKKPTDRTVLEADKAVRRLLEWHGDIRLSDLSRERVRDFRTALARVPKHLKAHLRKLPLRELIEQDLSDYPAAHAATINKQLTLLGAIVGHAEAEGVGKLDEVPGFRNPFGKGMKLAVDAREAEEREPFDDDDLAAIFRTGVFSKGDRPLGGGGEAAFWLPVLALLAGARQGELAQLRIMDVTQDAATGIWYLNISTAGGRTIKTASSKRKVPLHPALEGIGFLRYRQSLLDRGASLTSSLWPNVEADQVGRQSGPWSKWFNRYLRDKAGIEERTKVFHSFRHTFKRLARDARISEEMHDALTGHAGGGVGRKYGDGFGLKALAEEIARIQIPPAVKKLKWSLKALRSTR